MRDVLSFLIASIAVACAFLGAVAYAHCFGLQKQLDGLDTFSQLTRPYIRELHAEQAAELAELRGRVAHLEKLAPMAKPPVGSERP